jgi:hypothetical protein
VGGLNGRPGISRGEHLILLIHDKGYIFAQIDTILFRDFFESDPCLSPILGWQFRVYNMAPAFDHLGTDDNRDFKPLTLDEKVWSFDSGSSHTEVKCPSSLWAGIDIREIKDRVCNLYSWIVSSFHAASLGV